jgi:ssDNA-binding Zn-finger/Zn-ribbon topoisomerase 1
MLKKLFVVAFFILLGVAGLSGRSRGFASRQQPAEPDYRDNNCVSCHSHISSPLRLTSRYGEWHMSTHKEKGVGCEKCHGGDPKISDAKKAHVGLLPARDPKSPLHLANLPETCRSCHQNIVSSFVESAHFQKLKSAGIGPSCTTCHVHMGSQVLYSAEETATLCATCHNSPNNLMPSNPAIPQKADETMQAIRRANTMVAWADRLMEEADKRKLDVADLKREEKIVRALLAESKIGFHSFNLDIVRKKADECAEMGTKVKDALRARIYPPQ